MCVRACNALVLKLDYLSTTVCQKLHFLPSDAILRILTRASCACPRTLRVSAHISREDTQDGVSVGGFKMAAMSPVQLYIGQWLKAIVDDETSTISSTISLRVAWPLIGKILNNIIMASQPLRLTFARQNNE